MIHIAAICYLMVITVTDASVSVMPWNEPAPGWPKASPWGVSWPISESFQLPEPWSKPDYVAPNCFTARVDDDTGNVLPNDYPFDAQVQCPLCKNYTDSTPGFAADPNDCQGFYMCEKRGDTWFAYHMWCADCTFWNQEIVSCSTVEIGTCQADIVPMSWIISEAPKPKKMIMCIDFDTGFDGLQGQNGIWVKNIRNSVQVTSGNCVLGDCGYFDGHARLEVPFFSNNWDAYTEFAVSLFFRKEDVGNEEGMLSNDCFDDEPGRKGNSLFASTDGDTVNAGLKKPDAEVIGADVLLGDWNHMLLSWDGYSMQVYINGKLVVSPPGINFPGPIRTNSDLKCPLVIGSFILPAMSTYLHGFMDEICFFNKGLSDVEAQAIHDDPAFAYDL